VKTWQCVLFSIAVHGLIFGFPVMPKTPPDLHTKEIQLLVLESSPMDFPVGKNIEPVAAPKSAEPHERIPASAPISPVKQPMREPPALCKKSVPALKPMLAATVPKVQSDSETPSNKPSEVAAETTPAASPQISDGISELTPSENASTRSNGVDAGGHGSNGYAVEGNSGGHGHGIESTVGAMGGPQFIQRSVPKYPRMAQRLGVEGSVLLRLAIDASGKLTGVEVLNGAGNGFDEEAVQAVKRSTFAPAVRNGRPVRCLALLKIRFQLSS
jgi:periplasmic protein TonB